MGLEGMLVYSENGLVDPWLVSQMLIQATDRISPLVAVQPVYMHPYTVAKMIASLAHLHGRRTCVNLVAGGFRNDLAALGDETPHDERYARLTDYGGLIKALTHETIPVTSRSSHYSVDELRLTPPVPPELQPEFMISGSSAAGLRAARALEATALRYPQPPGEEEPQSETGLRTGIRIGIIARESSEEAWRIGLEKFPEDRAGQITHRLAMTVSDSEWHRQLSRLAEAAAARESPYWLGPFQNYRTYCPYLVGTHAEVAEQLSGYLSRGHDTFILDVPSSREDLEHAAMAFGDAVGMAA